MQNTRNGTKEKIRELAIEEVSTQIEARLALVQIREDHAVATAEFEKAKEKFSEANNKLFSAENQEKIDFETLVDLVKLSGIDLAPELASSVHFENLQIVRNARINIVAQKLVKDLVKRLSDDYLDEIEGVNVEETSEVVEEASDE